MGIYDRDKERMVQATAELEEKFKVGTIVQFGKYPQGGKGEEAPIEWIVLEKKGNGVKLLSLKGLETAPYNNETGATNWHRCSLRNWLNGEFLEKAFTIEEADSILLSDIKAVKSPIYNTSPGKDTIDKVFLLDYDEAVTLSPDVSMMYPTKWAIKNDYFLRMRGYGVSDYALWWLRSPGSNTKYATVMGHYIYEMEASSKESVCVRPALWLNLNSDFFYGDFEELVVDAIPDLSVSEVLEILKEKYQYKNKPSTIVEFEADNEEYSEQIRTLKNNCAKEYGMSYGTFLKYNGLMTEKVNVRESYDPTDMVTALQLKYTDASKKLKTLEELILDNPEYEQELKLFSRIASSVVGCSAWRFLKDEGILYRAEVDGVVLKQQQEQKTDYEKAEMRAGDLAERLSKKVDKIPISDPYISQKINEEINKLEAFFPEHRVFALDSIDGRLREKLSRSYKAIGYNSLDDMLVAYGFYRISGDEVRELRPIVLYTPGNEPEIVKSKVESIVRRLNEFYPNKIIERSLQIDHKNLAGDISGMYQWLGYENTGLFLQAYGFTYKVLDVDGSIKVGRNKAVFEDEIVEELKKRVGNTPYSGMKELREANPDLAGNIKTLMNKSNAVFGMTIGDYFKLHGIIAEKRERAESSVKEKKVKEVKEVKKPSTVTINAVGALADRVDRGLYPGVTLDELKESMEGFLVKYTINTDTISVNGSLRNEGDVEIPLGIEAVAKNAFRRRNDIVRVVLSESVVSVEKRAFEACDNLEEVVVRNPKCVFHPEAFALCNDIRIVVDRTSLIEEFMTTVDNEYKADYLDRIKILEKCIQNAGAIPTSYWAGKDWKLAFSIEDVVYQTEITAIGEDYFELDEIIEKVFMGSRVTGTLEYFKDPVSRINSISRTVYCDSNGNII